MPQPQNNPLITALCNPALFDHPVTKFTVIETHISWIILTGNFVYKIKKPVKFNFLDFSTLEKRHYFCQEELRLNHRYAPDLYLEVISITGTAAKPQINGKGNAFEYAIKMREFPQQNLLSVMAAQERLLPAQVTAMSEEIIKLHQIADTANSDSDYGSTASIHRWVEGNFTQIQTVKSEQIPQTLLTELQNWSEKELTHQHSLIELRKKNGFTKECHGDLHLGNIALIDHKITLFDCIEFNSELRWIDTISEVAFVMMDLIDRGLQQFSWRFINLYLQGTGDYQGLSLLRYYFVYRAMVRAKVAVLSASQHEPESNAAKIAWSQFNHYLTLAESWTQSGKPFMFIMYGLSGSGKSTLAAQLAETLGAIQIRSDAERKRLFDLSLLETSGSDIDCGMYSAEATKKTYQKLSELASDLIASGYPAIVDASFLKKAPRNQFRQLAKKLGTPFTIVECYASEGILRKRIVARAEAGNDPSEANLDVLEHQLKTREPLDHSERKDMLSIMT